MVPNFQNGSYRIGSPFLESADLHELDSEMDELFERLEPDSKKSFSTEV